MNNKEFATRLLDVANNYKTLYVMGCFGAPMNKTNKYRYINNGSCNGYNEREDRKKMIESASEDTFGFDCVNLVKGIIWGWIGDKTRVYGGAEYQSNGLPDVGTETMIGLCNDLGDGSNPINLTVGELLWIQGHVGVYVGEGKVVECTPSWNNCVQITSTGCNINGLQRRDWSKHGKLPWITYEKETRPEDLILGNVNSNNDIEINEDVFDNAESIEFIVEENQSTVEEDMSSDIGNLISGEYNINKQEEQEESTFEKVLKIISKIINGILSIIDIFKKK